VGGFVRVKILGRNTKDIDIVCIGDGLQLATTFANQFSPKPYVSLFKTYGTAQVKLTDIEIEFVGARKESYVRESRNPTVEPGTLIDDQNRRDFTINAMAIDLSASNFGALLDPFNGTATTGRSALLFRRRYVGYDLNPTYIKQSEIRLKMPTSDDIEELGVKIESKFLNFPNLKVNRLKPLKERMVTVDLNTNLDKLVEDGFTVFSSFPL
jgi:hypothetical protein